MLHATEARVAQWAREALHTSIQAHLERSSSSSSAIISKVEFQFPFVVSIQNSKMQTLGTLLTFAQILRGIDPARPVLQVSGSGILLSKIAV